MHFLPLISTTATKLIMSEEWQRYGYDNEEDESYYLWDGGMWKACKESEVVMEKHYNNESSLHHWVALNKIVPSRNCFSDLKGMSSGDLICVRPQQSRFSHIDLPIRELFSFRKKMRIAIEYDPSWCDFEPNASVTDLMSQSNPRGVFLLMLKHLLTYPGCGKIYMIDRNLRPDQGPFVLGSRRGTEPMYYVDSSGLLKDVYFDEHIARIVSGLVMSWWPGNVPSRLQVVAPAE